MSDFVVIVEINVKSNIFKFIVMVLRCGTDRDEATRDDVQEKETDR
jgi:hypothetical protein